MVRSFFLVIGLCLLVCDSAIAQFDPNAYIHLESHTLNGPEHEKNLKVLKIHKDELSGIFRGIQPLEVIALEISDFKEAKISYKAEWRERIEEEIRLSGIKVQQQPVGSTPRLLAKVLRDPHTKDWTAILEISELVFLDRPDYPALNCVTYRDKHTHLPSRQAAQKELYESVETFCWLRKKTCKK